jgi:hypothetical protein
MFSECCNESLLQYVSDIWTGGLYTGICYWVLERSTAHPEEMEKRVNQTIHCLSVHVIIALAIPLSRLNFDRGACRRVFKLIYPERR